MRYEITENNELKIYNSEESDIPSLFQPSWPDGTPWANEQEIIDWANVFIQSATNPDYEWTIGDGPSQPKKAKPTKEEIINSAFLRLGITLDDLRSIL